MSTWQENHSDVHFPAIHPMTITSKLPDVGTSIFAVMSTRQMASAYEVAAITPSVFYHDGQDNRVLRFCFAKRDETLEQAAEILCRI